MEELVLRQAGNHSNAPPPTMPARAVIIPPVSDEMKGVSSHLTGGYKNGKLGRPLG